MIQHTRGQCSSATTLARSLSLLLSFLFSFPFPCMLRNLARHQSVDSRVGAPPYRISGRSSSYRGHRSVVSLAPVGDSTEAQGKLTETRAFIAFFYRTCEPLDDKNTMIYSASYQPADSAASNRGRSSPSLSLSVSPASPTTPPLPLALLCPSPSLCFPPPPTFKLNSTLTAEERSSRVCTRAARVSADMEK